MLAIFETGEHFWSFSTNKIFFQSKPDFLEPIWCFFRPFLAKRVLFQISVWSFLTFFPKKPHFRVRKKYRAKKSPWIRKTRLEHPIGLGKGRKSDFSNFFFSIFANFRRFSTIFTILANIGQDTTVTPHDHKCENVENMNFGQKWP